MRKHAHTITSIYGQPKKYMLQHWLDMCFFGKYKNIKVNCLYLNFWKLCEIQGFECKPYSSIVKLLSTWLTL